MPAPSSGRRDQLFEEIERNVIKDPETGCWLWQKGHSGSGRGGGYGRIYYQGQMVAVHRAVFTLVHGYLHRSQQVDHVCCNRLCVNPDHLQAVTHKQNQRLRAERSK